MKLGQKATASLIGAAILAGTTVLRHPSLEPETIATTIFAGAGGFIAGYLTVLPFGKAGNRTNPDDQP